MTNAFDLSGPSLLAKEFRTQRAGSTANAFGTGPTIPELAPKELVYFSRARAKLKPGQVSVEQWLASKSDDRIRTPKPVRQFVSKRART